MGDWKPASIEELCRIAESFKAPMACELQMNHAGYELLRDEIPLASERLKHLGLPASWTGLRIVVVDDMPRDRIAIIDQYGKLLDVIMLPT